MRIGIDIDDTIVITVDAMIKYADKYDKEVLGGCGIRGNFGLIKSHEYLRALYGWDNDTKMAFFQKYYGDILKEVKPKIGASQVLQKWKEEGKEIYFITARLNIIEDVRELTEHTLKQYGIPYDKLIMDVTDKEKCCQKEGIDVFIDDSWDTCQKVEKLGIFTYLMTTPMNQDIDVPHRVKDWDELYEILNNMKD